MLARYTKYTEQIRHMQKLMRPFDDIHQIDLKRSELHRKLEELGAKLGKDTEDIRLDMLLDEGNLREYGINAPLIRLPMVGLTFRYREEEGKVEITDKSNQMPTQELKTPDGKRIAACYQQHTLMGDYKPKGGYFYERSEEDKTKSNPYKITIRGKVDEIEKWKKGSYFAIIFSRFRKSYVDFIPQTGSLLHTTRVKRMTALAKDFGLNLYIASDIMGHRDYGPEQLFGVEVLKERVDEIAKAMREYPQKYYLTEDELNDPYRSDFLEDESEESLMAMEYALDNKYANLTRNGQEPEWNFWYDLLRLEDVFKKKTGRYLYWGRSFFYKVNNVITQLQNDNPQIAEEMDRILEEIRQAYLKAK